MSSERGTELLAENGEPIEGLQAIVFTYLRGQPATMTVTLIHHEADFGFSDRDVLPDS